ncbi:hypothetical protein F2P81_007699 [Scophthalmus maximus]|uniref:Uncharacterized protein n=1 Tax=Scophthalmus maximus TaxID=52904 RepID=A0A6A4T8H2_SCOMX|nr:hypothetical protein F2P81_007699 [Scophthalmus maximus]
MSSVYTLTVPSMLCNRNPTFGTVAKLSNDFTLHHSSAEWTATEKSQKLQLQHYIFRKIVASQCCNVFSQCPTVQSNYASVLLAMTSQYKSGLLFVAHSRLIVKKTVGDRIAVGGHQSTAPLLGHSNTLFWRCDAALTHKKSGHVRKIHSIYGVGVRRVSLRESVCRIEDLFVMVSNSLEVIPIWTEDVSPVGDRLLSTEEQVTLITESMTVTSADQEKLLLLNRNTELRRVNKEVYRSATLGLQQKLEALELENAAVKQLNSRLLLKVEHQQSAKEYYEQTLMQELKKNQELQEYIRLLESRMQHPERASAHAKQGGFSAEPCPSSNPPRGPDLSPSHYSRYNPSSSLFQAPSSPEERWQGKSQSGSTPLGDSPREVQELKEQLDALRCQLKVYEDDFRRERSDKQMLQRLLLKKTTPSKDPVLIHRCNNAQQPPGGDKRTQSAEKRKQHHHLCPKHPDRDTESN